MNQLSYFGAQRVDWAGIRRSFEMFRFESRGLLAWTVVEIAVLFDFIWVGCIHSCVVDILNIPELS